MGRVSRATKQKQSMAGAVESQRAFFTAAQLHKMVSDEIGIATVYRYLKDEAKRGRLHAYSCGKSTIYSTTKSAHCHFLCTRCKRVEHIAIEEAHFLKSVRAGTVCHFQIDVHGICNACLRAQGASIVHPHAQRKTC
ncbi:TPA: hypothetical protein HA251_07995 [Candidatus Woesearchaeota archaeon]|nr:hypothetical protein [Candidatus Woesearchaeota archaeon]